MQTLFHVLKFWCKELMLIEFLSVRKPFTEIYIFFNKESNTFFFSIFSFYIKVLPFLSLCSLLFFNFVTKNEVGETGKNRTHRFSRTGPGKGRAMPRAALRCSHH